MNSAEKPQPADDTLTLAALGIAAYVPAVVAHEALGHGLAALAVGARPVMLTSCYLSTSGVYPRWIPAGGGIGNLLVGLLSLAVLAVLRSGGPSLRYFFVLVAAFNLFFAAGYPAYSGIALFGDWAAVISGLHPAWLYRILLVVLSVMLYYLSMLLVARELRRLIDPGARNARARLQRITLVPYLAAIAAAALAASFNPSGWITIFTSGIPSAAAAFGLTQMDHSAVVPNAHEDRAMTAATQPIRRSLSWLIASAIVLVLFVALLGHGIRLGPQ
jgi:hypothetical protein